jgi:small subunit ribosomal protein S1
MSEKKETKSKLVKEEVEVIAIKETNSSEPTKKSISKTKAKLSEKKAIDEVKENDLVVQELPVDAPVAVESIDLPIIETPDTSASPIVEEISEKEFDWDSFAEGGLATYTKDQYTEYETMYDATLPDESQAGVIDGKIINITDREAIIEIGGKSEGVISLNEFRYNPELSVGDSVEVLIDQQEDHTGQLVLSHRKARSIRSWDRVNHAHDQEEVVNGFVKCRTKGGMIVDVFGIEAFLPGSQIDVNLFVITIFMLEKQWNLKLLKLIMILKM